MLKEKDNFNNSLDGGETSHALVSKENLDNPFEKNGFSEKGIDFLGDSGSYGNGDGDGLSHHSKPSKNGDFRSQTQELTLSYLCDNSKLGFPEKVSYKGKEVISEGENGDENRWVERDFLRLNEIKGNSLKRDVEDEEIDREKRDKKTKIETLNLCLGLPDVSLSVAASNLAENPNFSATLRADQDPDPRLQSLEPSNFQAPSYSNDFTGTSLSYSYSHQFSHNPSCSLTEYSLGTTHFRDCGEGTNGSVHSRFRPVGDSIVLANQGNRTIMKDPHNNLYRTTSSENLSFFPSELPAKPWVDTHSGDSRGLVVSDPLRARKLSVPERIILETVSESIPVVAQMIQELTDETLESTKEYLKNLIATPEKRDELVNLQKRVERRSDLTRETLSKSNKNQLEILVSIKTGLTSFLPKTRLSSIELLEIFLLERCRNVNCKRLLPVDNCDCKICSMKNGFCSECMCPVCLKFDSANNTCSWVGCDVCSHWCHAVCGIERNLIKPGLSLKGPTGTKEMQFNCLGCGHASEMYGFVKDVFVACAKSWGSEALMKELDCVRKIFRGSEDFKGKELFLKAGEMVFKLEKKMISPSDVCSFILRVFNDAEERSKSTMPSIQATLPTLRKDAASPRHLNHNDFKPTDMMRENVIEDEWSVKLPKRDGFDSLESVVRVKEAEARMFQSRADEARREADGFKRMVRLKTEKLEEEYNEKLRKLCLQEIEERRMKKVAELMNLENSHCDYYKMKMRMQGEIAGLLERMESTKQQWVV